MWAIRQRTDRNQTSAELRWKVGGTAHSATFRTKTLADGRRAELMRAIRAGEPFDELSGLPMSEIRARDDVSWYVHARDYIEMQWPTSPAKTRTTLADALATATPVMVSSHRGMPEPAVLRTALYGWAFNVNRWRDEPPEELRKALEWVDRNALPMSALDDPLLMRRVLTAFTLRLDGKPAAPSTVRRKRAIFHHTLGYAVEARRLPHNPLSQVQWKVPPAVEQVEPACVVNPRQARELLEAVRAQGKRGVHLEAFFGCLYHAGLRPAEAVWLRAPNCDLPAEGWGNLVIDGSRPRVGRSWTDGGAAHDQRGLKWRPRKETRSIPIPPVLVDLLRRHIELHGTGPDGRLFRTARGGIVQESGYGVVWARAREGVFTPAQVASPLASRPYDLRHAAVSLWLNSGVDPAEVARRAGHSIAVLLRVYAKCLDGATAQANQRISQALEKWGQ
ncbi:tyrosine-type recombinase/integrase [Streptacidiphilus sp. ASG 303]|uniref:tyrosine-type recombinase/integrase n=1 Tax=Streptacidiphilus sp. ASG 303 TaxID=2896847 RepID=UPI001E485EE7|nr:tyrosine-type recombinase/integrase [Streptacidiphilus sp. ASG 303]MCD0482050.1 tyrosine-type recombinase/integrase [Streptacidiphilus sp. ASG 303]